MEPDSEQHSFSGALTDRVWGFAIQAHVDNAIGCRLDEYCLKQGDDRNEQ